MDGESKGFARAFNAKMAEEIGLNEAIVLGQLCYWISINEKAGRNFKDGRYWTYNTFEQWREQFPWWSVATIKRIFASLKKSGFIVTGRYNERGYDQTKWYAVVSEKLLPYVDSPSDQNDLMECVNLDCPIPKTTKEYQEETRDKVLSAPRSEPDGVLYSSVETIEPEKKVTRLKCVELFGEEATSDAKSLIDDYIDNYYPQYRCKEHPRVTHAARYAYVYRILRCAMELCYSDIEFAREALLYAVRSEKYYDPQIFLVTRPQVLGMWIFESGVSGPEICNDRYYGQNPIWLQSLPDISEIPEKSQIVFKKNYCACQQSGLLDSK